MSDGDELQRSDAATGNVRRPTAVSRNSGSTSIFRPHRIHCTAVVFITDVACSAAGVLGTPVKKAKPTVTPFGDECRTFPLPRI